MIIDCDTGVDDALALLLALRSPVFNVLGITTVAGNVPLEQVLRNTLVVVEHAGSKVPVLAGASKPLVGTWQTAEAIHGSDGLGDLGFAPSRRCASQTPAVDFLIHTFMTATQPIDLITLAPLTNVALALSKEPRLENKIHTLIMMAGGITGGNVTPAAEFNVWVDPEAADRVFRSHIPKIMVALDPIQQGGGIEEKDVEQIETADTPWCNMAGQLLRWQFTRWGKRAGKQRPAKPPDLAAMGVAIDPTIAELEMYHVAIETQGEHTRGMTVVDRRKYRKHLPDMPDPNVEVVTRIDNARYRRLVIDTLLAHRNQ